MLGLELEFRSGVRDNDRVMCVRARVTVILMVSDRSKG